MATTTRRSGIEGGSIEGGSEDGLILRFAAAAFVLEFLVLTALAWHEHWLAHPHPTGLDTSKYLEAEMVRMPPPEEAKLRSPQPTVVHKSEPVLSKTPHQGKKAPPSASNPLNDENVTEQGNPPLPPTHGPVAVFTPKPAIPEYLKDRELNASVVIEFLVSAQAAVTPRLIGSSGNEELDQLALRTAQEWKFRPAEQNHQPIDSKVRLRIIFEVK